MFQVRDVYSRAYPQRGHAFRIACYLCALGPGHLVTHNELYDLLWGRCRDGGPDNPYNNLQVILVRLRPRLLPGWKILVEHSRGISLEKEEAVHFDPAGS